MKKSVKYAVPPDQALARDRRLLVAGTALAYAAVGPWRDFPVLDDWAYAYTVKTLLATGRLRLSDWSSPSFALQALWGSLFCAGGLCAKEEGCWMIEN